MPRTNKKQQRRGRRFKDVGRTTAPFTVWRDKRNANFAGRPPRGYTGHKVARRFDGKTYHLRYHDLTKKEAAHFAADQRRLGYVARMVETKAGWSVYSATKSRHKR